MADDEGTVQIIGDDEWLDEAVSRKPGPASVRIRSADEDDAEGHAAATRRMVTVLVETDDDTEGHAISLHFPSAQEAEAFRKRLLLAGVLVGTVALGAAGGYALSSVQQDAAPGTAAGATITQPANADSDIGLMDASGFAVGASAVQPASADADIGLMDASGAFAVGASAVQPASADADIGLMDASGASAVSGAADRADEPPELVVGPR